MTVSMATRSHAGGKQLSQPDTEEGSRGPVPGTASVAPGGSGEGAAFPWSLCPLTPACPPQAQPLQGRRLSVMRTSTSLPWEDWDGYSPFLPPSPGWIFVSTWQRTPGLAYFKLCFS